MADLADLISLLAQQRPFPGGPRPPMLAKSPVNATGANIQAVKTPPMSSPTDWMNSAASMANIAGENQLRGLQAQQAAATIALMKASMTPAPAMYDTTPAAAPSQAPAPATAGAGTGAAPAVADYTADSTMQPEQRALLDSIAGPESGGAYNIRYTPDGGTTFNDYSDHPRIAERGPQGPSTAAGRYEIVASTWGPIAKKLGLSNFSPVSQDQGAWHLAETTYHVQTGRDLLTDLQNDDTSRVASALSGEWPTIGRGINAYGANLAKYTSGGAAVGSAASAPAIPEMPDTSLAGAGDSFRPSFGGGAPTTTGGGLATAMAPAVMPSGAVFGSFAPGSATLSNGQPAVPPSIPRNSQGQPYSPSLATISPQDRANVAASMAAIKANPTTWAALPPGTPPVQPIGFGSLSPLPPRASQAGPVPSAPAPQNITSVFGAMAPPVAPSGGQQISPAYLAWAQQQDRINALLGKRNPVALEEALKLQFAGPQAAAAMSATKPIELQYAGPMAAAQAWGKVPADLFTRWNSPAITRTGVLNPATGQLVGAMPSLQKVVDPTTGQETWQYFTPPTQSNATGTVSQPFGTAELGPGQRESLVTRANEEQKQRQQVIADANAAQQSRATLMNMANEASSFKTGPFAPHYQQAARYIRLIDPAWDGQVASYEDFVKNAAMVTRQVTRELSSREAFQGMQMVANSLPNPEMSDIGLRRVQNEMIGLTDYRIAKSQAQQQWEAAHGGIGNVSGFETAWQQQASPYSYIVARMDPADLMDLRNKLQGSTEGRQELARVTQQLTSLKQAGLVQ